MEPHDKLIPRNFAAAVARLELLLDEPPDQRMIAEKLRWNYLWSTLTSLAFEARAAGLVRACYDAAGGTCRYSAV